MQLIRDEILDTVYALNPADNKAAQEPHAIINYRIKTIRSGSQIEAECYPIYKRGWKEAKRKASENISSEQQKEINARNARKKFIRLLNCNFEKQGTHTTLTYNDQNLPKNIDEAQKDICNFIRRLKTRLKKLKEKIELKYIYVIESQSRDGILTRLHHHFVCNVENRDLLEETWKKGRANSSRLQPDRFGLSALGSYLTKGVKSNKKRWAYSQNLKKPTITVADKKLSRKRAQEIQENCEDRAKDIFPKIYPNTEFLDCTVKLSEWISGAYIYARLRKVE